MALKTNPQEYTEKWARNTQNARPDYEAGVRRVTEAPGVKAAQAKDKLIQGFMESVQSGRWEANVASVSLNDWQDKAINKGAARLSDGVQGAVGKVEEIARVNLANIEAATEKVRRMPSTTFQDRVRRMVAYAEDMHGKKVRR